MPREQQRLQVRHEPERRNFVEKLKAMGVPVLVVVILPSAPVEPLEHGPMRDEPERFHTLILGQIEEGLARL